MNEKSFRGNFFEDFFAGQEFAHVTPRTVTDGDRAFVTALYPHRFALHSSDAFARSCGLARSPLDELAAFHIVFGKSVPDISLNAVANLGYAECRFLRPVFTGDTLSSVSKVIGLRETSNGTSGIIYVRTEGHNQDGDSVLKFCRWVMIPKRELAAPAPEAIVPKFESHVPAIKLVVPEGFCARPYDRRLAGGPHLWDDYEVGERIDHVDGVTLEESEHALATRLWQNTARIHFNQVEAKSTPFGRRVVYGGHIISLARALSYNGLQNAQLVAAINAGSHTAPSFAGDTIYAWSEVLDRSETVHDRVGALRLRTVALKNQSATRFPHKNAGGRYESCVVLDLDWWVLIPR